MPTGRRIAEQKALGTNTAQVDTKSFTWRLAVTLCWKAGLTLIEETPGTTTRTFALYTREPVVAYSPHSDLTASLQERGEQSYTTEPHELSALDAYRETAGLTSDEDDAL